MSTTNCVELVLHNGQTAKEPISSVFDRDEQIQPSPPPASEEENKIMKDEEINYQGSKQDSTYSSDFAKQIKEMRSMLMIVAALLLQMSYQAGLNPPGGFWQDDPSATAARSSTMTASSFAPAPLRGENGGDAVVPQPYQAGDPIMRFKNHRRYREFEILNAVSLACSAVLILSLPLLSVVQNQMVDRLGLPVAMGIMYMDLMFILLAYNIGAVTPENRIISLIPNFAATVVVFLFCCILHCLLRKMRQLRRLKELRQNLTQARS
ncbi:uncharacterized protein LOC122053711 [Zingiber officinale]|uniref:uncharacterized protein LOC122053711 n=1 Tax=Zingiber officinale TaxID=94328 RepID=UPI001C4D7630|nr:uncharacterized protein LOC122053711 [Zingiber officinale]